MSSRRSSAEILCLSCGFCCSGTLHNWTYLQPEELSGARAAGLDVVEPGRFRSRQDPRPVFRQPCRALEGTTCQIYPTRPQACRNYVCHVLQRVESGDLSLEAALDIVRQARRLVDDLRSRMPHPASYLSLDWQLRVNWPPESPLPEDVQPIFDELAALLQGEWKTKWRRKTRRHRT